ALYSRSRARNLSRRNMHSIIQQALVIGGWAWGIGHGELGIVSSFFLLPSSFFLTSVTSRTLLVAELPSD
ncbi:MULTISPECIES: hypothetical protein, partial [unclassified Microcoleus]|uniref:hypothetical protein n=1 Tax=unclassified Microcoleus TaxID=2642155 RepID=UPI002FD1BBE3